MTLRELEIFYRVCETPHLSHLAETLSVSQSALSLSLRSLETKLGEPLFDRIGKKLVLNERGRAFREKTLPHYLALKEARAHFSDATMSGTLRIAASKTIGNYLLPRIVWDFLSTHPEVRIESHLSNSETIIALVQQGSVDLGFIEAETPTPTLVKNPLGEDELVVVSSDPNLPKTPIFIDRLFHRKWLMREEGSGTRRVFLEGLGPVAERLPVFMEYHDFDEAKNLLLHTPEAITCLSRHVVARELAENKLFIVPIRNLTFKRHFYRIHHRHKHSGKLFEAFSAASDALINLA